MNIEFLEYPLYMLHYIDDVTQFSGLNEKQIKSMTDYEEHIVTGIKEAVLWAVQHPEFDFMEFDDTLRHSNEDIYDYLCKVAKSLDVS